MPRFRRATYDKMKSMSLWYYMSYAGISNKPIGDIEGLSPIRSLFMVQNKLRIRRLEEGPNVCNVDVAILDAGQLRRRKV